MPALCVGITFWLEGAWSYLVVGKFFPRIFVCIKQWLEREKTLFNPNTCKDERNPVDFTRYVAYRNSTSVSMSM